MPGIAQGVLGLEATHTWYSAGWPLPSFILNELENLSSQAKVTKITGLHDLPDSDDERAPRTAHIGEIIYPGGPRGKTVVYEGTIRSTTLDGLRLLGSNMRFAFSERSAEGQMSVTPVSPWGTQFYFYKARVIALSIDEEYSEDPNSYWGFKKGFSITLRQSDPRYYAPSLNLSGYIASGVSQTWANLGTAPTDPDFLVGGPVSSLLITKSYPEIRYLAFTDLAVASGELLVVRTHEKDAVIDGTGAQKEHHLYVPGSDLWDEFVPQMHSGDNTFQVDGGGGTWRLRWWNASW